ncbi:uncharacterized protein LOC119662012 [Teleopsis dalmanni]|uniref:uncharacterized protein LOC119662012 n=1 Tax=Teleopsis dalmanni TaxID=139649 RepID=UPI0018CCC404|nr:uncharacterized protein LOC119662012 [Teleopsis dalmanni]
MSETISARHNRNDLFTREECEKILSNFLGDDLAENGKLLQFEIVPELGSVGYLGQYFHLNLSYQLKNAETIHRTRLFVKVTLHESAEMSSIFKKETMLYETLLNELRKFSKTIWCAQCYYTRKDLVVMQNVVDLGYEPFKQPTKFLTEQQIKPLLKGLATLHACSIGYELKNKINIGEQLKDVLYEVTVSPTVTWYTTGIKAVIAVIKQHPGYQKPEMREFLDNKLPALIESVYAMVNPSTKYRNVFCHRDPWGGNICYSKTDTSETPAVFVDFQLCRYSPAAIDVLMALYLNLKPKERRELMAQSCTLYYEHFEAELSSMGIRADEHMSRTEFENSMKDLELYGALYNCMTATILRVPDGYLKNMKLNNPDAFHRYANIERTEQVLDLLHEHQSFREYMFECIRDFMDLILSSEN